ARNLRTDAVDVFRPADDLRRDPRGVQFLAQDAAHFLDVALAIDTLRGEPAGNALVVLRIEVAEAQVLQLPLELPHAQAVGERRIDLAGLICNLAAFRFGRVLALP